MENISTNPSSRQSNPCSICFEALETSSRVELQCKHVFHIICLDQWIDSEKNSCPLCRKEIYDVAWKTNYTGIGVFENLPGNIGSGFPEFIQMKKTTAEFWNPRYNYQHLIDEFFKIKYAIRDDNIRRQSEIEAVLRLQRNAEEGKIYCIALLFFAVFFIHSHTMNTPTKPRKIIK